MKFIDYPTEVYKDTELLDLHILHSLSEVDQNIYLTAILLKTAEEFIAAKREYDIQEEMASQIIQAHLDGYFDPALL